MYERVKKTGLARMGKGGVERRKKRGRIIEGRERYGESI
jgi:hypothetical protein